MSMDDDASLPLMLVSFSGSAFMMILVAVVAFIIIKNNKKKKNQNDDSSDGPTEPSGDLTGFKKTGVTFFGQGGPGGSDDNGVGFSGVSLYDYRNTFNGKPLFPGAVYQRDGPDYLYKVIELYCDKFKSPGKTVYLHIVDVCAYTPLSNKCKVNTEKYGFLVDVHYNAFEYVGLDDGLLEGSFKVVGTIRPNKIPRGLWTQKVQDGKGSVMCSCTGDCKKDKMDWKPLSKCK